jgi:hypothetical protein
VKATTLKQLFEKYLESLPTGALEASTLALIRIHKKHLCEHLGSGFTIQNLKLDDLKGTSTSAPPRKRREGQSVRLRSRRSLQPSVASGAGHLLVKS